MPFSLRKVPLLNFSASDYRDFSFYVFGSSLLFPFAEASSI